MVDILAKNVVLMLPLQDKLETPYEQYRDMLCFSSVFFFFSFHIEVFGHQYIHGMDFFPSVKLKNGSVVSKMSLGRIFTTPLK